MYQQPPELGGALEDEKRAELPEQSSMFELDGEDHTKSRGFDEPAKEPIGDPENEIDRTREPTKRPVSPLEGEVSPVKDEVSPSNEQDKETAFKKPTIQTDNRVSSLERGTSRFNEEISPIDEPAGLASRTKSIRDKALPPKPPLDG